MAYIQIQTTFSKESEAQRLAELVVGKKLAACVQIIPLKSIFRWKGKLTKEKEFLCIIKTKQSLMAEIIDFIKNNHSYKEPEIIATEIIDGSKSYLNWIGDETK